MDSEFAHACLVVGGGIFMACIGIAVVIIVWRGTE